MFVQNEDVDLDVGEFMFFMVFGALLNTNRSNYLKCFNHKHQYDRVSLNSFVVGFAQKKLSIY